ncbi:uncharacterized protein LOC129224539 [Uloborus diversus]|uniref:uncharacterized protein LOC129224539 n=1 Tax=Uloborus diversus TaxID=327109 RepID=UPI00240A0D8F|nr:uncharacterized protein LOC129224539 [Uloborus diversus]
MAQRILQQVSLSATFLLIFIVMSSSGASIYKFQKAYKSHYPLDKSRIDRRIAGRDSPIHFITPLVSIPQSLDVFSNFFSPPANFGPARPSPLYKLPLKLFTNGKPHNVMLQSMQRPQSIIDYLPQAMSKIIRLPIKYMSNAKPVGVYFDDPSFNYI